MKRYIKKLIFIITFFILIIFIWVQKKELDYKENKKNKFRLYYDILNRWLKYSLEGTSISSVLKKNNYMTVGIYGMGEIGKRLYDSIKNSEINICYIIDQGKCSYCDEMEIKDLNDSLEPVDVIIVTPVYDYKNIKNKIKQKYPEYKVVSIIDVLDWNIKEDINNKL